MGVSFKRKFSGLSDPVVVTAPFTIELDEDKCIGCGLCVRQCPCQTLELVEREFSDKQEPSCQYGCPAGVNVRGYLSALAGGGSFADAWRIITETNPFPAVTGRVCPRFCEQNCNRKEVDDAVNINGMEHFIGDYGIGHNLSFPKPSSLKEERIAVVGAGPAGLSCACHLARMGYGVTVYEAGEKPGGMLINAIPSYRLPEAVVDAEIRRITDLGVEIRCGSALGTEVSLDELKEQYHAVYVAIGAQKGATLGIDGEDAENVWSGLDFLWKGTEGFPLDGARKAVVIGGGNTAIDAARAAKRRGLEVTVLYRRSMKEMPAGKAELEEAVEEGVDVRFLAAPRGIRKDEENRAVTLDCVGMKLGERDESGRARPVPVEGSEFSLKADIVIAATGQQLQATGLDRFVDGRWIEVDRFCVTAEKGVFAGGDAVTGPATVSEAIGMGLKGARAIDAYLRGATPDCPEKLEISYRGYPLDGYEKLPRQEVPVLPVHERLAAPEGEIRRAWNEDDAAKEARRCLLCGKCKSEFTGIQYFGSICIACHNCEAVCPHEALTFPNYYKVDQGRWTTDATCPERGRGYPNPLMEAQPPDFESLLPRITDMEQVIYRRRSNRVFKREQVPKAMIHRVLEAGRFAPSAGNGQPWKFLVIRDRAILDEISASCVKTLSLVTKIYQGKDPGRKLVKNSLAFLKPDSIDQRPMVAIQALVTPKFSDEQLDVFFGAPTAIYVLVNRMGISKPLFSVGMCCQNMVLAAHALGLGTCYTGFATEPVNLDPRLKKKLDLAWPYDEVATAIAVGLPAVPVDKPVEREFPPVEWIE